MTLSLFLVETDTRRMKNFPKITQLVSAGTKVGTQAVWLQISCCYLLGKYCSELFLYYYTSEHLQILDLDGKIKENKIQSLILKLRKLAQWWNNLP